jgi:SAM-dependent methyltransferase
VSGTASASSAAERTALIKAATLRYRSVDRFAFHFARSKLRMDPVFTAILRLGLLRDAQHILDLGCGIGILESWLRTAHDRFAAGQWPSDWPAPPAPVHIQGIDHDLRCAQAALGTLAHFICADARNAPLGRPDAVVILDMLHYMDYTAQTQVLANVRAAIDANGILIMRIGDANGGLRFKLSEWMDRGVLIARRGNAGRLYCRPLADWRALLARAGFASDCIPMVEGTPFANQLLVARPS